MFIPYPDDLISAKATTEPILDRNYVRACFIFSLINKAIDTSTSEREEVILEATKEILQAYEADVKKEKEDWTLCTAENNYCGTGNKGAQAKDNATGLVWSYPLSGVGGKEFDANPTHGYSWDNSAKNNDGKTAEELCSQHEGWRLPTKKELLKAFTDGSRETLDPGGVNRVYWSASAVSVYAEYAWDTNLSHGNSNYRVKTDELYLRCVR